MVAVKAPDQAYRPSWTVPMRSVRRATARRASSRRAFARSRQTDSETRIIEFVAHHPGATIGDLARSLNFPAEHIASCLTQLTNAGELQRMPHGYSARDPWVSPAAYSTPRATGR